MSVLASQITSISTVCSVVCSGVHKRKHQNSASLAFVRVIHLWPMDSPRKGPVTRKMFPFDHVIMGYSRSCFLCALQLRHNEGNDVSNHQPHDGLLNRLLRRRSKKTSKLRVTGICARNSPVTGEFPTQRASNVSFDDVITGSQQQEHVDEKGIECTIANRKSASSILSTWFNFNPRLVKCGMKLSFPKLHKCNSWILGMDM